MMDTQIEAPLHLNPETIAEIAKVVQSLSPPQIIIHAKKAKEKNSFPHFLGRVLRFTGTSVALGLHAIITNRDRIWKEVINDNK